MNKKSLKFVIPQLDRGFHTGLQVSMDPAVKPIGIYTSLFCVIFELLDAVIASVSEAIQYNAGTKQIHLVQILYLVASLTLAMTS